MSNQLLDVLSNANHMMTLDYQSEPEFSKKKFSESKLAGHKVTCLQRVQVNPVRHYLRLKAKKLGIPRADVTTIPKPGWETVSEGIVKDPNGNVLLQAAPVRELSKVYMVDGRAATESEVEEIRECLRRKKPQRLQLKSFRVDRIRCVKTDHETVEV